MGARKLYEYLGHRISYARLRTQNFWNWQPTFCFYFINDQNWPLLSSHITPVNMYNENFQMYNMYVNVSLDGCSNHAFSNLRLVTMYTFKYTFSMFFPRAIVHKKKTYQSKKLLLSTLASFRQIKSAYTCLLVLFTFSQG